MSSPTRQQQIEALFSAPLIHEIAADLDELRPSPRSRYPLAGFLAFGALSRLFGSANRVDAELASGTGPSWRGLYNAGADAHGGQPMPARGSITSDHHRHARDWLVSDEALTSLCDAFTRHSITAAQNLGLLDPAGGGSFTRPAPTRTIYGDGTVVRPAYSNSRTGLRVDPDAAKHVRHDGTIVGNNLVTLAVRGPEPYRRVLLAIGRCPRPGTEADTAVELLRRTVPLTNGGTQAVVYDGAFRGVHHDTLMTDLGVVVVNKVHPVSNRHEARTWRIIPIARWTHGPDGTCAHTLVAYNGSVHEISATDALADIGPDDLSDPLRRLQVRRYRRRGGPGWRFMLGVELACSLETITAWISPHRQVGDPGHGRPDQVRLLPPSDPWWSGIYGLRNDSEAINAAYKRTLYAGRAAALGWRRQVLDLTCWAILGNALAWQRHASTAESPPAERVPSQASGVRSVRPGTQSLGRCRP